MTSISLSKSGIHYFKAFKKVINIDGKTHGARMKSPKPDPLVP